MRDSRVKEKPLQAMAHELGERERGAEDERNSLQAALDAQRAERSKEASAVAALELKLRTELADVTGLSTC